VFHDDNGNLVNDMWYNYYTYYFKDADKSDKRRFFKVFNRLLLRKLSSPDQEENKENNK
jgi:hypothetical protein